MGGMNVLFASREEFDRLVVEVCEGFPEPYKGILQDVGVWVWDEGLDEPISPIDCWSSAKLSIGNMGVHPLFGKDKVLVACLDFGKHGIGEPNPELESWGQYSWTRRGPEWSPVRISIYMNSILRRGKNWDAVRAFVQNTVEHELGHHLGLGEDAVRKAHAKKRMDVEDRLVTQLFLPVYNPRPMW